MKVKRNLSLSPLLLNLFFHLSLISPVTAVPSKKTWCSSVTVRQSFFRIFYIKKKPIKNEVHWITEFQFLVIQKFLLHFIKRKSVINIWQNCSTKCQFVLIINTNFLQPILTSPCLTSIMTISSSNINNMTARNNNEIQIK